MRRSELPMVVPKPLLEGLDHEATEDLSLLNLGSTMTLLGNSSPRQRIRMGSDLCVLQRTPCGCVAVLRLTSLLGSGPEPLSTGSPSVRVRQETGRE